MDSSTFKIGMTKKIAHCFNVSDPIKKLNCALAIKNTLEAKVDCFETRHPVQLSDTYG
jgi:hypothetical protein